MFENKNEENVVEQTLETKKYCFRGQRWRYANYFNNNLEKPKDYLDPSLFDEIKVVSIDEDNKDKSFNENDQKVEELYANTFGDISEKLLLWKVE